MVKTSICLWIALLLSPAVAPASSPPVALALRNVAVIDVGTGDVAYGRTVLIDGEAVSGVLGEEEARDVRAAVEVDGRGMFLVPGLWDMHVHLADPAYLPRLLARGVTGVRDMGGGLEAATDGCESLHPRQLGAWRDQIARGERVGPHITFSGPALSGSGWPTSLPARTPEQVRESVQQLASGGVDFVKVYEKIPLDAFRSLAEAARDAGLPFAGHVPEDDVSLLQAIDAGQRSIEHVRAALLACFTDDEATFADFMGKDGWGTDDMAWGWARHRECPAVMAAARRQPVWFTPTLVVERAKVAVDGAGWDEAQASSWLPPSVRDGRLAYARSKRAHPAAERASERLWWETQQRLVGRLAREGVALLAGTDSACQAGVPGESLHQELELLVAAGVPVRVALASATLEPARYLGLPPPRITTGARADLVLLSANPLVDIRNTRAVQGVALAGRWFDRRELDELEAASDPSRRP